MWSGYLLSIHIKIEIACFYALAPKILNINAKRTELTVSWSNDDKKGVGSTRFRICWTITTHIEDMCSYFDSTELLLSRNIKGLKAATKYTITVARYGSDKKTLGARRRKNAITRSGTNVLLYSYYCLYEIFFINIECANVVVRHCPRTVDIKITNIVNAFIIYYI